MPSEAEKHRCALVLQESAKEIRLIGDALEANAAFAESHGGAYSPEMMQRFVDWYQRLRAREPDAYPALHRTDLTKAERDARAAAEAAFKREEVAIAKQKMAAAEQRSIAACPWRQDIVHPRAQ